MIVYVSGPMRGYAEYNFPAFHAAAADLRAAGYEVLSPAEKDLQAGFDASRTMEEQGFDLRAALRWDCDAVLRSDAVFVLDGWEESHGAQAEVWLARAVGIPVYEVATCARV